MSGCFRGWDDYDPSAEETTGSGNAALCGGVGALAETFDDGFIDARFWTDEGGAVVERDGELVFTLPTGAEGCGAAYMGSEIAYDLTGRAIGFELRAFPQPPDTVDFHMWLRGGSGYSLHITINAENVSFGKTINEETQTLASQRYDAAQHRFFRIREADGSVYWEVSGDGQEWIERAKADVASLFDVRYLSLELAGTGEGATAPAEVRIDNLAGSDAESMCAMNTFSDDFEDGVRSNAWTVPGCLEGCAMTESNGELAFLHDVATSSACSYTTASAYDLHANAASIELTAPPDPASDGSLVFQLTRNSTNFLQFRIKHGELYCVQALDGDCGVDLAYTQFSPVDHRWLRFREADGTIYYETSADGIDWHTQTSTVEPFQTHALGLKIESYPMSELAAPLEVRVDNVNRTP